LYSDIDLDAIKTLFVIAYSAYICCAVIELAQSLRVLSRWEELESARKSLHRRLLENIIAYRVEQAIVLHLKCW